MGERTITSIRLAVIYYSSGGTNYQLAKWAEEGAREVGAEVKVLKVPETAPQECYLIKSGWKTHFEATKDVPEVTLNDLEWADAIIFSASQVRVFIDTTGGLWFHGKLANKVVSAMVLRKTRMADKRQPYYRYIQQCITGVPLSLHLVLQIQLYLQLEEIHMEQV